MDKAVRFIKAARNAKEVYSTRRPESMREVTTMLQVEAGRELRRALGNVVTELDAAVFDDLMKILKKLSKGIASEENGYSTKLRLALDIIGMSFSKSKPPDSELILWKLNKIYNSINDRLIQAGKWR